jgi:hypothetical protein
MGLGMAAKQEKLGYPAPEINAAEWINSSGPISLAQLRGQVVVVCLFSTTEERSLRAIFEMKRVQEHFAKKGVVFVALTDQDRVKGEVDRFVKRHKITFPVGTGSPTRDQHFVGYNSYAFVVDAAGNIVWKGDPARGLQAAIELGLNRSKAEKSDAKQPPPPRERRAAPADQPLPPTD